MPKWTEMCHYLGINENFFFKIRYFQKEKDLILSDYLFSRYRFCKKLKQVSRIWVTFSKRGLQWLYGCHKILGFRVYRKKVIASYFFFSKMSFDLIFSSAVENVKVDALAIGSVLKKIHLK